jgi:predicted Holliday junction resolvase-like endonuclease
MDIILFIIIIVVIVFIYYLINTIKDLQIEIKTMSNNCFNKNDKNTDEDDKKSDKITNKPSETIDVKIKNDVVSLLDYLKMYFI